MPFAAIGAIASVAGTALSVYTSIESGNRQDELFQYQAALEQAQARAAQQEAQIAAQQQRSSNQGALAKMRAQQGQGGTVDAGSALENLSSFARNLEADALDIERQGKLAKNQLEAQSEISRIQGRNARRTGHVGAGTSLIKGTKEIAYGFSMGSD